MIAQILWQSPRLLPLAVAIAAVAVGGVIALYVPQARRVRHPWRWGLPILRATVCLAVAASVLRPALVRSVSSQQPGAVVFLMDRSRSMSVVDPRTPAERVALADALGLLPADRRVLVAPGLDQDLRNLQQRVDEAAAARVDADYAKLSGQGVIAAQARYEELVGGVAARAAELARQSPSLPGELSAKLLALAAPAPDVAAIDYKRRLDAVEAALDAARRSADAALYEASADVKRVADESATLTRAQLAERAIRQAQSGGDAFSTGGVYAFTFGDELRPFPTEVTATRPSAEPRGLRSDITGAAQAAMERMKGRPVQAVIVLSDGRQVGADSGASLTLAGEGVPVFGVLTGSTVPRDVSLAEVTLVPRQFVGETTLARVRLRGAGMKGVELNVRIDVEGRVQSRSVVLEEKGTAVVEFPVKFDAAAVHPVTVSVAAQPGEMTTANNVVRRWIAATSDRVPVSLISASASWDFQQVHRAMARAPWATVDAEVLDSIGARWSAAIEDFVESRVVMLFDVTADHLTGRQWDVLYDLVAYRGGTLIIVAGRNTTTPEFIDSPLLTDLLPFRAGARPAWRSWAGEQPLFRFQPGPGDADAVTPGPGTDFMGSSFSRWLDRPALFQYLPVTDLKPNTTPLLTERESGVAVLTDSRLGLGHVLFFGINETWRWRRAADGVAKQERFWQQLARYAVDAPYAVRSGAIRLDADRVSLTPGQTVRLRARVTRGGAEDDAGEATLPLTVLRDGVTMMNVPMAFDAESSDRYSATLGNLAPGSYELQLPDPHDPSVVASLPLHVEPDVESEMRNITGDDRTLRRLAEASGGEVLRLDDWKSLPGRLSTARGVARQVTEKSVWDSPQLFAFILGCLGIEWTMRKRLGLA